MMFTRRNTISLFTGIILLGLLFNPVKGILDIPHHSCLFVGVLSSIIIGILAFFPIRQPIQRLTVIDLLFLLIAVSSIYFYPPTSNLMGLARFTLIIIYWSIRQTGGLNDNLLYFLILAAILILSTIGYLQELHVLPSNHPHFNITGPYGNPTIYAGMLCLLVSVPVTVLFPFKKIAVPTYIYLLNIFICIIALPILWLTHCRAAWIAILVVIGYAIHSRFSFSFRWKMYGLLLTILISYLLYQYKPTSADGRILIWKVTAQMIKEKPLTGFGPSGFKSDYMHFQGNYLKKEGTTYDKQLADNNHYVYNEPLRWSVEYGIAGLLLYIGILYIIFSYKSENLSSLTAKMICIAGVVWGLFSYPDDSFPILLLLVIALAEMANGLKKDIVKCFSCRCTFLKIVIFIALVGQGVLLIKMYQSHRKLYQISQDSSNRSPEETIAALSLLETDMENETVFWAYYCHTLDIGQKDTVLLEKIPHWERLYPSTHTYILKGDALQRIGKLKDAETAYWTAHYMVPSRQKARYKLALLYYHQGYVSKAWRLANEVLTEKVKNYGFETYEMHRELRRIFENQFK